MTGYFFAGFAFVIVVGVALGMQARTNEDVHDVALIDVAFKWIMANLLVFGGLVGLVATILFGC